LGFGAALDLPPARYPAEEPGNPGSSAGLRAPDDSWPEEDTNMTKRWMVAAGALALALASAGCNKEDDVATAQAGYRNTNVVEQASTRSIESEPAVSGSSTSVNTEPVADVQVAGSKAPDLLAKASMEVVSRGETIEISAQGSPDVTEMILYDGYGTTQSLVFDADSNTWKTAYRVPLNMKLERLGLSIKAKNGDERWRRVWVFLNLPENAVAKDAPASSAVGDTTNPQ
jgi:hypothetical protein